MATKIEGGHSNVSHWEYTEVIKKETKRLRRTQDKKICRMALKEKI
jgi:hypothetical protein